MRNIAFSILGCLILNLACLKRADIITVNDFDKFTSNIPSINLPFSATCWTCCKIIDSEIDTSLNNKFNPDHYLIVGKILIDHDCIGVLYAGEADFLVPILITYDNAGNRIAEASFLSHTHCGQIVDNYGASFFTINKQFDIIEKDTHLVFMMDTINFSIIDTIERNINFRQFKIDKSGKIIKINAS